MTSDETLLSFGLQPGAEGLWTDETGGVAVVPVPTGGFLVGRLDVEWLGAHEPVLRMHGVKHVPEGALERTVRKSRREWAGRLQTCTYCGRALMPGLMHDETCCHGCAERHLGVIH